MSIVVLITNAIRLVLHGRRPITRTEWEHRARRRAESADNDNAPRLRP